MVFVMVAFFQFTLVRSPRSEGLLITLGQTSMFFYLLHFPLLVMAGRICGVQHRLGLIATYAGAAGVVIVLHPACRWYRHFKSTGRHGWTRYI
jgi:peptidoglycan/LPS O-acetylase OafA/YrhL